MGQLDKALDGELIDKLLNNRVAQDPRKLEGTRLMHVGTGSATFCVEYLTEQMPHMRAPVARLIQVWVAGDPVGPATFSNTLTQQWRQQAVEDAANACKGERLGITCSQCGAEFPQRTGSGYSSCAQHRALAEQQASSGCSTYTTMHSVHMGATVQVGLDIDPEELDYQFGQVGGAVELQGVWLDGVDLTPHLLDTALEAIQREAGNQFRSAGRLSQAAAMRHATQQARRASDTRPVVMEPARQDAPSADQMAAVDEMAGIV